MDSLALDEWSGRHSSYVGPPPVYPWNVPQTEPTQELSPPVYPWNVPQPEDTSELDRCDGALLSDEISIPTFNLFDRDGNPILPKRTEKPRKSISERIQETFKRSGSLRIRKQAKPEFGFPSLSTQPGFKFPVRPVKASAPVDYSEFFTSEMSFPTRKEAITWAKSKAMEHNFCIIIGRDKKSTFFRKGKTWLLCEKEGVNTPSKVLERDSR